MLFADVWGFDEDAVKALKKMELELKAAKKYEKIEKRFQILLSNSSNLLSKNHNALQVLTQFIVQICVSVLHEAAVNYCLLISSSFLLLIPVCSADNSLVSEKAFGL